MADLHDNVSGAIVPDGEDDSSASVTAKLNYEQYKKVAAQNEAVARAKAMSDDNNDKALLANEQASQADKKEVPTFSLNVTSPKEVPAMFSEGRQQGGGMSAPLTGDYYTMQDGGFLQLDNADIIAKVRQAAGRDPAKFESIYQVALARTALLNQAGKSVSLEDVLNGFIKDGVPSTGGGGGGGAFNTTSRSVSLTNEGTSRRLLNQTLTAYLGRQATTDENKMFLKALNVQEKANPVTTVTKGYSSGGNTNQTQNSSGGFDSTDYSERFAKSQEGYAEYKTATTFLDAFIETLDDQSRVVG
jgi:hypothetical protein